MTGKEARCKRSSCHCTVAAAGESCSPVCRSSSTDPSDESERDLACGCGHADCYRQSDSALISGTEVDADS